MAAGTAPSPDPAGPRRLRPPAPPCAPPSPAASRAAGAASLLGHEPRETGTAALTWPGRPPPPGPQGPSRATSPAAIQRLGRKGAIQRRQPIWAGPWREEARALLFFLC